MLGDIFRLGVFGATAVPISGWSPKTVEQQVVGSNVLGGSGGKLRDACTSTVPIKRAWLSFVR
jgi:hypothetical protein